jgi:hypothetical protein
VRDLVLIGGKPVPLYEDPDGDAVFRAVAGGRILTVDTKRGEIWRDR